MNANETIFVFPGQGSQTVGMAAEFMLSPELKGFFEEVDELLGFGLTALMREGPAEELGLTQNTQPALVVAGYVAYKYFASKTRTSLNEMAKYVAGHSLGEYTALAAAGALSFTDAVKLVRIRGEAMAAAVPQGEGAMAAIIGLTAAEVAAICEEAGCHMANDNAEGQVVISGTVATVEAGAELAKAQNARKVVRLDVSGPFHSPLMQPTADKMVKALSGVMIKVPEVPVLCNVTAMATTDPDEIKKNLIAQVTGQVRWRETMINVAEEGVTDLVEFGSGKVLTGLARRCDTRLKGKALQSPTEVDGFLEEGSAVA